MFALGTVELSLLALVLPVLGLVVLYLVIRLAVKHGTLDAHREREADEARRRAVALDDSRSSGL